MGDAQEPVEILSYDQTWVRRYEEARAEILRVAGEAVRAIEHIGSTAVPGLDAKPIIDILLAVQELPPGPPMVEALQGLGYEYLGEHGIAGRHFFRKGTPRTHHVHVVQSGSAFWGTHLRFRDLLRDRPALRSEYAVLKRTLAGKFGEDRRSYTDAKGDFIRRALTTPHPWAPS